MATEYGVCPRCGLGPPAAVVSGPRDDQAWQRAGAATRRGHPGAAYFAAVATASLGLGALLAAWALGLL